jgi:inner membrane protein
MDSLTQLTLGAAVGVAVMARRTAVWKAALWGGVCGTLPDLDALIDHGNPVLNMVLHRAETHALFWQTLAAPAVAAGIAALDRQGADAAPAGRGVIHTRGDRWRDRFPRWWLAVWLVFVTHALLDAMTVYGTQLALPFTNRPYGLGSVFIIDPLYTVPLLAGLIATLVSRKAGRRRWNDSALALSTAYLAWSVLAQQHVEGVVRAQLAADRQAAPVERVLVTPTAFNTVLWRVVLMRPDGYDEGFYSLLDGERPIRYATFARDRALYEALREVDAVARIAAFSQGFFRVDARDGVVRITDLRMGQEPSYVFSFAVARIASPPEPIAPKQVGGRDDIDIGAALRWLWQRLWGADIDPPR